MARAKRHFIPGYFWHTPVKQRKKKFNGVNNPSMPQTRIPSQILKGSPSLYAVAVSGQEAVWIGDPELHDYLKS